mmetsp:Transcript_46856/g.155318  ORF Transcript_46856/g.155318 Transcript_46856/m.155318 type:complete len:358 (+) Transcript_46856:768-1841(+)
MLAQAAGGAWLAAAKDAAAVLSHEGHPLHDAALHALHAAGRLRRVQRRLHGSLGARVVPLLVRHPERHVHCDRLCGRRLHSRRAARARLHLDAAAACRGVPTVHNAGGGGRRDAARHPAAPVQLAEDGAPGDRLRVGVSRARDCRVHARGRPPLRTRRWQHRAHVGDALAKGQQDRSHRHHVRLQLDGHVAQHLRQRRGERLDHEDAREGQVGVARLVVVREHPVEALAELHEDRAVVHKTADEEVGLQVRPPLAEDGLVPRLHAALQDGFKHRVMRARLRLVDELVDMTQNVLLHHSTTGQIVGLCVEAIPLQRRLLHLCPREVELRERNGRETRHQVVEKPAILLMQAAMHAVLA